MRQELCQHPCVLGCGTSLWKRGLATKILEFYWILTLAKGQEQERSVTVAVDGGEKSGGEIQKNVSVKLSRKKCPELSLPSVLGNAMCIPMECFVLRAQLWPSCHSLYLPPFYVWVN